MMSQCLRQVIKTVVYIGMDVNFIGFYVDFIGMDVKILGVGFDSIIQKWCTEKGQLLV